MIFDGRVRVRYGYSRWGWTRGGGKTWHGGSDEEGLDSTTIRMPGYNGKAISGKVVTARKVDRATGNPTWEWGWYVCVQLDANQTPDAVNYLYFCHNAENLVTVGQRVQTGDALAVMGNTGNAALADPPFAHCHFEVRATATGTGLDPTAYTGHPNAVGTYGQAPGSTYKPFSGEAVAVTVYASTALSAGDVALLGAWAAEHGVGSTSKDGAVVIGPLSAGDQISLQAYAAGLSLQCRADTGPATATVTGGPLNVRTRPGTSYPSITQVQAGEVYEVADQADGWYCLLLGDGCGWCSGDYLEV